MPFIVADYVPNRVIYSAAWDVLTTDESVIVNE